MNIMTSEAAKKVVPRTAAEYLLGVVVVVGLVGLVSGSARNLLPAESILDGAFLVASLALARRLDRRSLVPLIIASAYIACKSLLAYIGGDTGLLDFIQAYKAYFYLVLLSPFLAAGRLRPELLVRALWVLSWCFLVKYLYAVLLGFDSRPGVYTENNYEIPMLLGLYCVVFRSISRRQSLVFLPIFLSIALLGASRSGAVAVMIVYIVMFVRYSELRWAPFHVVVLIVTAVGLNWIFTVRAEGGSLQTSDRYRFFEVFENEIRNWTVGDFILGSYPLTPLSTGACARLEYFESLFSYSSPGHCYSVILHSYLMRGIFDHGILGMIVLYAIVAYYLYVSSRSPRLTIAILLIATASGFSVSSFNNVFTVVMITLAMSVGHVGLTHVSTTRRSIV